MSSIEEGELVKYLYQFDLTDKLNCATIILGKEKIEIFNRKNELEVSLREYVEIKSKNAI
ncbi:hypothetical protein M20_0252 [Lactococcus lactis subsp. lactis]|uniref:Uncharacterized protein n=2 Tax=Lactococcus lactis TaxID=1358 RepID=A0A0V8EBK3_LACLL|nr:hypothetical protein M20_0252 [Lactococcus lactis subsp. lactis]